MPSLSLIFARLRNLGWRGRELSARLAYVGQRRLELGLGPDAPEAEVLAALDARLADARADHAAGRLARLAIALNDLDERVAALEQTAQEAAEERAAHQSRVDRLRAGIGTARGRLGWLRAQGIGTDGLAMLEARLAQAERSTSVAAIAAAEAELAAVDRAVERLAARTGQEFRFPNNITRRGLE